MQNKLDLPMESVSYTDAQCNPIFPQFQGTAPKLAILKAANRVKTLYICGFSAVFQIQEFGVFLYHSFRETAYVDDINATIYGITSRKEPSYSLSFQLPVITPINPFSNTLIS